jgi:hypothetical protein
MKVSLGVIAGLALYLAAYGFLLEPAPTPTSINAPRTARRWVVAYRCQSDWVKDFFAPANKLDQAIRPSFWEEFVDMTWPPPK